MNISMIPNNDVKTIHASQGDTQRVWNFVPYGENGVINTSQDEYASFDSIKGNTIVWNQQVPISATSTTTISGVTFTNNGDGSITVNGTASAIATFLIGDVYLKAGHSYFVRGNVAGGSTSSYRIDFRQNGSVVQNVSSNDAIVTFPGISSDGTYQMYIRIANGYTASNLVYKPILIDVTQAFGSGNEPTYETMVSLFPLSYYPYDSGSLLSFNGSGIKTTDSTLSNDSSKWGNYGVSASGYEANTGRLAPYGQTLPCEIGKTYTINLTDAQSRSWFVGVAIYDATTRIVDSGWQSLPYSYTVPSGAVTVRMAFRKSDYSSLVSALNEVGKDLIFELYTATQTTDLPTLTYFPTGMKSAGSVYDELTPTKAVTRVGSVDLGTIDSWTLGGGGAFWDCNAISTIKGATPNLRSSKYVCDYASYFENNPTVIGFAISASQKVRFYNSGLTTQADVINALQGVILYYELATPTEADIDEDLTYPVEVGGTEELLPSALYNGWVDLGSLNWIYHSSSGNFYCDGQITDRKVPLGLNAFCTKYSQVNESTIQGVGSLTANNTFAFQTNVPTRIIIRDTSYSSAETFKQAMNGVYLWYEKSEATPGTTPMKAEINYPDGVQSVEFTYKQTEFESQTITGSMVCKGLEIEGETDENGISIQSTSELTSEPGFFDCKLKLTQGDGVCYSSKFQLHVERRP